MGSAGIEYDVSDNLFIDISVRSVLLSLISKKSVITKYTVNGEDKLSSLTTRDKETEFKDDDSGDTGDPNQPDIANSFSFPSHSLNIKLGIGFRF